jgi:D-3-phosphoglycerate dehydrogenase
LERPKILIAEPLDFSAEAVAILRAVADVELRECSLEELPAALCEYDVLWLRLAHRMDETLLAHATRCRFIAVPATGTDHIDHEACQARGIEVVSLKGEVEFLRQIRATAELTLALTLALLRQVPQAASAVRQGRWNRDAFRGREVFGKTVGLVGVGRLGTIVADYFRALGANVIGYDPRPDFPHQAARQVTSLDELMRQSDIVSVHAVYDATTRGLLGAKELQAVKPGAIFVNTSRGGIVDDPSLLAALTRGQLAGAALDVLEGEPYITATHPLVAYAQSHDNLLIVPHIGGNTWESFARTEVFLAEKLVRLLQTQVPSLPNASG